MLLALILLEAAGEHDHRLMKLLTNLRELQKAGRRVAADNQHEMASVRVLQVRRDQLGRRRNGALRRGPHLHLNVQQALEQRLLNLVSVFLRWLIKPSQTRQQVRRSLAKT